MSRSQVRENEPQQKGYRNHLVDADLLLPLDTRAVYGNGHLGESVVMDMTRQEFYELREDLTDRLPDPFV